MTCRHTGACSEASDFLCPDNIWTKSIGFKTRLLHHREIKRLCEHPHYMWFHPTSLTGKAS